MIRHESRYICDRCKIDSVQPSKHQPPGWATAECRLLPDGSVMGTTVRSGLLCVKCKDSYVNWWIDGGPLM